MAVGAVLGACAAPPDSDPTADAATETAGTADGIDSTTSPATAQARIDGVYAVANALSGDLLSDRVNVLADDSMAGRDNLTEGGKAARAWIKADLVNMGLSPVEQPFDKGVNVCATVAGTELAKEHVVLGAHYDHLGVAGVAGSQCHLPKGTTDTVCNGATDNAAGVATLLFVGRALVGAAHKPRRSVMLCFFDAEEDGLLGSYHFTGKAPLVPLVDVVAMFSVDNVGSRIFPTHTSSFATDAEFSPDLRDKVLAANAVTGFVTWPVSSFFVGQDGGGRSDHKPFREQGIPVLFLGSGSASVYHTPADEPDAVDFSKLLKIARHAALLTAMIANDNARPAFVTDPKPHLDDARAMVAIADKVLADPKALNLDDTIVGVLKIWRVDLQAWLDKPPQTAAEWAEYDKLIHTIIKAVYAVLG